MNILYLCQFFEVGNDTGSERHFFFCKYAVAKGHRVDALTGNVDYKNAQVKISGKSGIIHRSIEGVDIHYVYSYANFRGSITKRIYYYLTFFFSSIMASLRLKRPDVIYAVSTPLTVGLLGYVISRLRGTRFVFEVTDVWPDALVACGLVKNRAIIKFIHWLEMFCYRKAAHIVGLTRGICDNIVVKGIDKRKVSLITNGVDFSLFNCKRSDAERSDIREKFGFGERFVAMYLGAHGAYNALDTIMDAAEKLRDDPRILFVFVGDGDEKAKLQRRASAARSNVFFLPPIPRTESVAMLSSADAFVLPNRKGNFFAGNLPNKIFDYLASGRPIVVTGIGETPDLVIAAGCGKVGPAEDGLFMAKSLIELADMSEAERLEMGTRGREYVWANYDRKRLSERFLRILEKVTT